MKYGTSSPNCSNVRTLIVSLLTYVLLTGQLAPLAMAANAKLNRAANGRAPISNADKSSGAAQPISSETHFSPVPKPLAQPAAPFAVNIVATKTDNRTVAQPAAPGDTINYTVVIQNLGSTDATNVTFTDTIDANTTLVPNSIVSTPVANNDTYNVVGNVRIQPNAAQGLLTNDFNPDNGNATGITASGPATSTQGGNVTVNADGSFSYNPAAGFAGTDTFTYTLTVTATGKTDTATVTLNVGNGTATPGTNVIWFINSAAAPGGDGRLTNPFNCFVGAGCFSAIAADDPGDTIFLYDGAYSGGYALLANQRLIGQGAGATLASISGATVQAYSDALPVTNGNPANVTITTSVAATNAVNLGVGNSNTLRGFTIGNTTGAKIASTASGFGTLTVSEVTLNGNGQALNLDSGTLAATFTGISSNLSSGPGINLDQITGSLTATAGTTITDPTAQCILVTASPANLTFNNTSCTLATDGISLQNNSGGTRTFGTLSVTGATGIAFLHSTSGGNVTVTGTATLSSAGDAISVSAPGATNVINFLAATSATRTGAGGNGVNWAGTAGATMTFSALTIQTNAGIGLNATVGGTINVTNGTGTINSTPQAAPAIVANGIALNANFSAINSSGGTNGVSLTNVTGTSNFGGGALSGATGATFNVSGGTASVTYSGNITQANNAAMVFIGGGHATGTITFQTGTLSATSGTGLQFDNADGTYNFNGPTTLNGGDAGVDIFNGSGGTFTFGTGVAITNPTGIAYREDTSTATVNYNGTITKTNNAANAVDINAKTGGATTFSGAVSATTTTANAIDLTNTGGTVTFRGGLVVSTTSGVGFNATGAGTTVNVCDENPCVPASTGALVNTLTSTTGTALNVVNTTIGANRLEFRSISSSGAPSGIILNATGTSGGLKVVGTGSAGTGGTIANSTSDGIAMTSTDSPNLNWMAITDSAGTAADEGIVMSNITGSLNIANCTITNAPHNGITVDNFNTNMTSFVLLNTTIQCQAGQPCQPAGSVGNDGLLLQMRGTSVLTSGSVTSCTFSGMRATAIQVLTADTARIGQASGGAIVAPAASNSFTVTTSSFTNNNIAMDFSQAQASNMAFQILNNTTITGHNSHAINFFSAAGATGAASHFHVGKIDGNVIGTQGTRDSGSRIGNGIRGVIQGQNTQGSVTISNNTIREVVNASIIALFGQQGAAALPTGGSARFKVINNTMPAPSGSNQNLCGPPATPCAEDGIFILADEAYPVCNVITGNNIYDVVSMNGTADVYLAERSGPPAGAQLTVEGTGGSNSAYIIANNTLAGVNKFIDEGGNTTQVALGACGSFPSAPSPMDITGPEQVPSETLNGAPLEQSTQLPKTHSEAVVAPSPVAAQVIAPNIRYSDWLSKDISGLQSDLSSSASGIQTGVAGAKSPTKDVGIKKSMTPKGITPSAANFPLTIGTLGAGKSVTITFSVTVNNPVPPGTTQVSNQGTISGNDGATPFNVLTDDPDVPGTNNPTVTGITQPPDINIKDAQVGEPTSGQTSMLFTVALSAPAPGSVSVNFATANGGATPATGGATCDGVADYLTTNGTVNFIAGQQIQTISVPVCSDATVEGDETFLVNLSTPTNGIIVDGQATGTITPNVPGVTLISELRTSGPGGTNDDFVEIYNNTSSPLTIAASDASPGYGLFKIGADCGATPVLIGTIPNGTVIPARGHYLSVGSAYSLANYGGTGAAAGNLTLSADIENDRNVALFNTTSLLNLSSITRLDAVGFGANTGNNCDLLREGTNLATANGSTSEHSFVRKLATGTPQDTNDNVTDFSVISTTPATPVGGNAAPILGGPGPQNLASPLQRNATIKASLIDTGVASTVAPNRVRDTTPDIPNNSTFGTLDIRRKFTNNTGGPVTRLRFRIVDVTTFPQPGGTADLRARTSGNVLVTITGGTMITVLGTTLEVPPAQPNGGGLNSTMAVGTVTVGTPIANGASIDLRFLLGVQQNGGFRFFVNVEALP